MLPGLAESGCENHATWMRVIVSFSYSVGVSIPRALWRLRRLWKISKYSNMALASSTRVDERLRLWWAARTSWRRPSSRGCTYWPGRTCRSREPGTGARDLPWWRSWSQLPWSGVRD